MKMQMKKKSVQCWIAAVFLTLACSAPTWAACVATALTPETPEVQFTSTVATDVCQQAQALATPVAIYEYLRNNHDYSLYHGSRSGSENTLMGMRGNDVDLASTLIAMYRSIGIQARYAVSTVRAPTADVMNWLGVKSADLATSIMTDQGIQGVVLTCNRTADPLCNSATLDFEHVWVDVLVPFTNYRGAGPDLTNINCQTQATSCHWISLDPSYKLRQYLGNTLDPYSTLTFDYNAYYNALNPSYKVLTDTSIVRGDKNPLEIYQEQILSWLRTTAPGKTLDDVADPGTIIAEQDGILPASLPYAVVGTVRRYNAVSDHDLAEAVHWAKYLTVNLYTQSKDVNGVLQYDKYNQPIQGVAVITAQKFLLTDLTTQQLTVTFEAGTANCTVLCAVVRKGLTVLPLPAQPALTAGDPLIMSLTVDGSPYDKTPITATYYGINSAGGYYLLGTGGYSSNWSQVHRAANSLLAANKQYPIINDASGVPYVDLNGNGVIDTGEPRLLDDKAAMDALTGGLLYVAMNQYFAKTSDALGKLDHLNRVITPIEGFVGVVSSTYDVQYVAGTAFSVLPGGLLIDMKGMRVNGPWRVDSPATVATNHFGLVGHILSSYEHEIWQELTGYDAVSTVRGIQMALASGATVVNPKNVAGVNNWPTEYLKLHFATGALTYTAFNNLFFKNRSFGAWGMTPVMRNYEISMLNTGGYQDDNSFKMLLIAPSSSPIRQGVYTYPFYLTQTSSVFDWLTCYQGQDTYLYYTVASYTGTYNYQSCNGTTYTGTVYSLWQQVGNEYLNWYLAQIPTAAAFLSTTGADPLVPTNYMYSGANVPAAWDNTGLALSLRDNIYSTPGREYIIPSQRTQTAYNTFTVYVAKQWSGTNLASQSFIIENWGGGYVPLGGSVLTPATSIAPTGTATASIQPTFNNATLNDMTVVNETNNNLIKTPSTADPVSTVTGNNYHDETDITIKGRGINYAFTRTYNSTPSSSAKLGSLGYGWTHSYAMKLKSNPYGICPDCNATQGDPVQAALNINGKTNSITYTDERGGDHNYLVNSTTLAVTPPQGEFDNLAFDTPVAGQHTLTFRNGTKYVFQSLTSTGAIQIAAGVMQGTPGVSTRLIQIADPYGNQLNFTYDATGRLSNIADNLAVSGRTG